MIFFSIVLLLISLGCFFAARGQAGPMRTIDAAGTFNAQMLLELYNRVVPAQGGAALAQPCEAAGTIEADEPLIGLGLGIASHPFTPSFLTPSSVTRQLSLTPRSPPDIIAGSLWATAIARRP